MWKRNPREKEPSVLLEPVILQHYTDLEVVSHAKMPFQLHRAGDIQFHIKCKASHMSQTHLML